MRGIITINPEIRDAILESGGDDAIKCYSCGRCMAACPWNLIDDLNYTTYQFCQRIKLGAIVDSEAKEDIAADTDEVFRCVGCDSCRHECPRGVNLSDVLRAVRRILVDYDSYPAELKSVISRLYSSGNPLGLPAEKRADWTDGLDIPRFDGTQEYVYFPCCLPAYDARAKLVARATAGLLKKAGVSFGVIGEEEYCCGEAVRRVGAEKVFQAAVSNNTRVFQRLGARNVITTSPHCFKTFRTEYPAFTDVPVVHVTQLLHECLKDGRLRPERSFKKKVVYHDPCTLGRQMGVYDEPREILQSIPDLELLEVPVFNREFSVCCGAGAMGLWRDWPQEERLVTVRAEQLLATGADVLCVACPYCLQMFEENFKSMNEDIAVMDITEILFDSVGP
jgi:Fe-S oxidoreductase